MKINICRALLRPHLRKLPRKGELREVFSYQVMASSTGKWKFNINSSFYKQKENI